MRTGLLITVAALAACLGLLAACAPQPVSPSGVAIDFPYPLSGPGRPVIERSDVRRLDLAWRQLLNGQYGAARNSCSAVTGSPHAELLLLQLDYLEGEPDVAGRIENLANSQPQWAAAWLTLSIAAESEGRELTALSAAEQGAALWHRSPWLERPGELRKRWVGDRVSSAEDQLADGDDEEALRTAELALAHESNDRRALMVKAKALLNLERVEEAEPLLEILKPDPEALLLSAGLAESRADWLTAMDLYRSLPPEHPDRRKGLNFAQLNWRLSVLPGYVHEALASTELTRAQLAVILVALAPDVEAQEGGNVPLLSDIVELPFQREILSAVRVDLLSVDPLEPLFRPNEAVGVDEVQDATVALAHLLGFNPPLWCNEYLDEGDGECLSLVKPITGTAIADVIMGHMEENEE